MNRVLRLSTIFYSLAIVGCAHSGDADYSTFIELAHDIQDDVRGDKNIPHRGFMFLYKGPWGWSEPEYRFTVDINKNYSVEFMELKEQSISQARTLWDSGVRTQDDMNANIKATRFRLNSANCSIVPELTNEIWKSVTRYSSNFNHAEAKRVILDGGYSFNFYLSDGDYNTLKYSVFDQDHPLTLRALKFIEQLKSCNKEVNNTFQNIQTKAPELMN
jgi:hypothetical protein